MVFHGKSTRGNASTNQGQTSQSAPQSTAAPATGDTEKASATSQIALTKKKEAPSRTVNRQEGQLAPAPLLHPLPIVLPAGTVPVRLNEAADKSDVVEQLQQAGKIKCSSSLSLRLTSITVAGIAYPMSTSPFLEQGKGKSGWTTKMGAGDAATGVRLGGLTGGGKGALIGSVVGARADITGSVFTGNNDFVVPAESLTSIQAGAAVEA